MKAKAPRPMLTFAPYAVGTEPKFVTVSAVGSYTWAFGVVVDPAIITNLPSGLFITIEDDATPTCKEVEVAKAPLYR